VLCSGACICVFIGVEVYRHEPSRPLKLPGSFSFMIYEASEKKDASRRAKQFEVD